MTENPTWWKKKVKVDVKSEWKTKKKVNSDEP